MKMWSGVVWGGPGAQGRRKDGMGEKVYSSFVVALIENGTPRLEIESHLRTQPIKIDTNIDNDKLLKSNVRMIPI